jgi:hypothetical protein
VSLDASSSAASVPDVVAIPLSLSAQVPPADRQGQAQDDGGEGKEEAVGIGDDGGGLVVDSTDSASSNVHRGHGRSGPHSDRPPNPTHSLHTTSTLDTTSTHCCQCHIRHPTNGYGTCMLRSKPRPDCECAGQCPIGRCAQYECTSRLPGYSGHSVASHSAPPVIVGDSDGLHPPHRRQSGRPSIQPQLFIEEQAAQRELALDVRDINQMEAAVAASVPQPAVALAAAVAAAAARIAARLPTVADVASHRPLHNTIPYADHTAWTECCAPVFEQYRQASDTNDMEWMASSLIELLQLPGKYLYKQHIHTHERRMLNRQQLRSTDWQMKRLSSRLRRAAAPAVAPLA